MTMLGAGGRSSAARAAVVVVMAAVAALLLLLAAATDSQAAGLPQAADNNAHAMASPRPAITFIVDPSPGNGHYTTIQAAINAAPVNGGALIKINPGTYREKVVVNKNGVSLLGTGPNAISTIVTWKGFWSNTNDFALFVQASDFVASRITFQNTFGKGRQAIAARVDGDKAVFYDCRFLSFQDTLFDTTGRHYYHGCYIEGATDFIFGNGKAFFESCHLHSISDGHGAFTAQGREALSQDTGFSFVRCHLTGRPGKSILGRPWRPYARVVFALCNISKTVSPVGWNDWNNTVNTQAHSTAYFGQYQCYGEGSKREGRVAWAHNHLSADEAAPFLTADAWVDGQQWLQPQYKY